MKTPLLNPEDIRQQIWKELGRATQDRHHAWRTPVLATACGDGEVNARTVVLRAADAAMHTLSIYTDRRSPKVAELTQQANAMFVFWSARLSWQLRVRVNMSVQTSGPLIDALWHGLEQSAAAGDYLSLAAPGEPLPTDKAPDSAMHIEHHFSILTAHVIDMDWLELARTGHRRANLDADRWTWLTP